MDRDAFLAQIERLVPGHGLGLDGRLDQLGPYPRLVVTRWLADVLERPTDLTVVRRLVTVREAWHWLEGELRRGERLRHRAPVGSLGSSTRVRLRPVLDDDLLPLYLASFDPAVSGSWRFRGRTVPVDEFVAGLGDGVRAQYVVELLDGVVPVGIVTAYDHHQGGRHCKVALLRFACPRPGAEGAVLEGLALLVSHLFASHPYRKVYVELPGANVGLLPPGLFEVEGVLRDYAFQDGGYVDLVIASLRRSRWQQQHEPTGW